MVPKEFESGEQSHCLIFEQNNAILCSLLYAFEKSFSFLQERLERREFHRSIATLPCGPIEVIEEFDALDRLHSLGTESF